MKRILVFSWFYPPINSSEGLVTYKLLKNSKYKYDVFTQNKNTNWSYGNGEKFLEANNVKTICSNSEDLEGWKQEAIEYYKKNMDKYDIIMSRSMPPETHEVCLEIKRINPKVFWLASFGDPIAKNPFTDIVTQHFSPFRARICGLKSLLYFFSPIRILRNYKWKKNYAKSYLKPTKKEYDLQLNTFKNCDKVILNSTYQRNYMLKSIGMKDQNRCLILPHSYDESLYPKIRNKKRDKIKITYIGHLDSVRSPRLFLKAISDLRKEIPLITENLEVQFYGNISDFDKVYIINEELYDIVKVKKPVNYLESLKIISESDWLLHIDANLTSVLDENIFFAAKLSDYLGGKNNIFGITMLNGISADILRENGALVVSHSVEDIKNYLYLILTQNYRIQMNPIEREKYNSLNVAEIFDEQIRVMYKNTENM